MPALNAQISVRGSLVGGIGTSACWTNDLVQGGGNDACFVPSEA